MENHRQGSPRFLKKFQELCSDYHQLNGTERRFKSARSVLYETADSVLRKRRAQLLSEGKDARKTTLSSDFLGAMIDNGFTDAEIRGSIVTIFFAGHDNFLNVLGWSLHELSRASDWLVRMREEAFEQGADNGVLQYSDINVSGHERCVLRC